MHIQHLGMALGTQGLFETIINITLTIPVVNIIFVSVDILLAGDTWLCFGLVLDYFSSSFFISLFSIK